MGTKVIKGSGGGFQPTHGGQQPAGRPMSRPAGPAGGFAQRPSVIDKQEVQARSRAQEILQQAQQDAQLIRSQAEEYRQKGYEEGYAAGLEEGKAELVETILKVQQQAEQQLRQLEPEVVRLSLSIAQKIIGKQLELDHSLVVQIVGEVLGAARHRREIFIRVSPDDYDIIAQHKAYLLDQLSRAKDIDIRADPAIQAGGCLIETEVGTVEATLEKQLQVLEKILLGQD